MTHRRFTKVALGGLMLIPLVAWAEQSIVIPNPIAPIGTIPDFIYAILSIVVEVGVPIAVFFIIYAGFLFATAQGNEAQLEKAKKAFLWALVGSAVLLGALILAKAVQSTLHQVTGQ